MLADTVRAHHPGKSVSYVPGRMQLLEALSDIVEPGDLLITMGAGDVTTVGPEFIDYLTNKE